jgi:hypothetical protein
MRHVWILAIGLSLLAMACGELGDKTVEGKDVVSQQMLDAIPDPNLFVMLLPQVESSITQENSLTFWRLTRSQVSQLNTAIADVLAIMDDIRPYPPTTATDDQTIWELTDPINPDDNVAPRFAVSRVTDTLYRYSLAHRNVALDGSWVELLNGDMTLDASQSRTGDGEFELDFNAMATADSTLKRRGQVMITVSSGKDKAHGINLAFTNYVADSTAASTPRNYPVDYLMDTDGSGSFNFSTWINWIGSDLAEQFDIHNRWDDSGAGQVQVVITGGEITDRDLDSVEIRECWSSVLGRTYYIQLNHWSELEMSSDDEEGDPESCVFEFEELTDL